MAIPGLYRVVQVLLSFALYMFFFLTIVLYIVKVDTCGALIDFAGDYQDSGWKDVSMA